MVKVFDLYAERQKRIEALVHRDNDDWMQMALDAENARDDMEKACNKLMSDVALMQNATMSYISENSALKLEVSKLKDALARTEERRSALARSAAHYEALYNDLKRQPWLVRFIRNAMRKGPTRIQFVKFEGVQK